MNLKFRNPFNKIEFYHFSTSRISIALNFPVREILLWPLNLLFSKVNENFTKSNLTPFTQQHYFRLQHFYKAILVRYNPKKIYMQDSRKISNVFFFFLTVPVVSVTSSGEGGSLCSTLFIFSSALFVFSDNERRKAEMKFRLHPGSFSLDGRFDFLVSIIYGIK